LCRVAVLKFKGAGRRRRLLLLHPLFTSASSLCVLQVHKTTLHRHGGLKELTFFPW